MSETIGDYLTRIGNSIYRCEQCGRTAKGIECRVLAAQPASLSCPNEKCAGVMVRISGPLEETNEGEQVQ